jgi:excisionase family DNA binding protein
MNNRLLKANEVAEKLSISRSQAFTLMRSGDLPTVRFGRLVRVRPEDLETFITRNLSSNPDTDFKTKFAAVTANVEINQVNHSQKEATYES